MWSHRTSRLLLPTALLIILGAGPLLAQTVEAPFDVDYTLFDLGPVPGLPPLYGGLTFLPGDPDTVIIGGHANTASGALYTIGVDRDGDGHIVGFVDEAVFFADGAYNDGGVTYGPGGVLFLARWPVNELGQTLPGSTITDKIIDLTPWDIAPSPGGLFFVPPGFPGAGQLKMVSWAGGQWYQVDIAPDGLGTFDITGAAYETTIVGGPEGFIYVPPGSPQFPEFSTLLVSEYSAGQVAAYQIDANGAPDPATRVTFVSGLTGAEGAVIDPLTGDFLFSTFGGGDRVIVVQGFVPPTVEFRRGDTNGDGVVDISDPVFNVLVMFGFATPLCLDSHDDNDDGVMDLSDPLHCLTYLFLDGPPIAQPSPDCGLDITTDDLSCGVYDACP